MTLKKDNKNAELKDEINTKNNMRIKTHLSLQFPVEATSQKQSKVVEEEMESSSNVTPSLF